MTILSSLMESHADCSKMFGGVEGETFDPAKKAEGKE